MSTTQSVDVGSPDWWLARLIQRLSNRQERYERLENYAVGNHPLPDGDTRYVKALRSLQEKAKTNYISLVNKAVSERMRVKEFKFNGVVDKDAGRFWKANDMELQSAIAIADAAKFGESYTLVSPPDEETGVPVITVEDPRLCIVERDPVRPLSSLAGLKLYNDSLEDKLVAVLYLPDETLVYHGPKATGDTDYDILANRVKLAGASAAGWELVEVHENPLGKVPLLCGVWQPETTTHLAECEDGALEIQDRINYTMLSRLIIMKSQAYRQRLISGLKPSQKGNKKLPPFDPGADAIWVTEEKDLKVFDFQQAEIKDLLEAVRDDIGDLAALTQTPVTYLTNRMVNVSGDALHAAQHSHVAKVRRRMDAMGWYFENVIKLCFRYQGDARSQEVDAEVQWSDPEVRTLAELADMANKFAASKIPLDLIMERLGFSSDEIEHAQQEAERIEREGREHEIALKKAAPPRQETPQRQQPQEGSN